MPATNTKKVNFNVCGEQLAGIVVSKSDADIPSLLFLHGGGGANKYRTLYLAERLLTYDISSFAFDHSGSGESTGMLEKSSLQKRHNEAVEAIKFLTKEKPLTICGSSMGAYIALKLLGIENIKNLILFCPAIYDARAFSAEFNNDFTAIIRQKESFQNSDIFSVLEKFEGNLLIFIGQNDEVIPKKVIDLLDKSSLNTKKKEIIIIPGCPHKIHTWLSEHRDIADEVAKKVSEFCRP